MKTRLLVALVEIAGASFITYQQLPADRQQRIRMIVYRNLSCWLYHASGRMGQLAMQAEIKYAEEAASNG